MIKGKILSRLISEGIKESCAELTKFIFNITGKSHIASYIFEMREKFIVLNRLHTWLRDTMSTSRLLSLCFNEHLLQCTG